MGKLWLVKHRCGEVYTRYAGEMYTVLCSVTDGNAKNTGWDGPRAKETEAFREIRYERVPKPHTSMRMSNLPDEASLQHALKLSPAVPKPASKIWPTRRETNFMGSSFDGKIAITICYQHLPSSPKRCDESLHRRHTMRVHLLISK